MPTLRRIGGRNNGALEALRRRLGQALLAAVHGAHLAAESNFATNATRVANREALLARIEPIITLRPRDEWIAALEAADVPYGPVNDIAEAFAFAQAAERNLRFTMRGNDSTLPQVANPLRLAATPPVYHHPPPRHGADTRNVLTELLNLADTELISLEATAVIQTNLQ